MVETTLICPVTNNEMFNNFEKSLNIQTYKNYEIIKVENINNQYSNAAEALNYGAKLAKGEYLIFLHQDIVFLGENSLKKILDNVKKINSFAIVGVAGCEFGSERKIFSNIYHGKEEKKAGISLLENTPIQVQTVDECFFIILKEFYDRNNIIYRKDSWHLYAVEYCLQAIRDGEKVFVVPADLLHFSAGASLDYKYYITMGKIIKKYGGKYKYINTTVRQWKTSKLQTFILKFYTIRNYTHHKYYYYIKCISK